MAYKVRFALTRSSTVIPWQNNLESNEVAGDHGRPAELVAESGGSFERTTAPDGLTMNTVYTFPDVAAWQAYHQAVAPIWNRNDVAGRMNTAGITVAVEVIENT